MIPCSFKSQMLHIDSLCFFHWQDATLENEDKAFYDSEDSEKSSSDKAAPQKKVYVMDADHRLLLRASKPLLNSRNSAVCAVP